VGRLHDIADQHGELARERVEVNHVSEACREGLEGARGVVFAAVEPAVDEALDAGSPGTEQSGNRKG